MQTTVRLSHNKSLRCWGNLSFSTKNQAAVHRTICVIRSTNRYRAKEDVSGGPQLPTDEGCRAHTLRLGIWFSPESKQTEAKAYDGTPHQYLIHKTILRIEYY